MSCVFPKAFVLTGAPCSGKTTIMTYIRGIRPWRFIEESGHRVFYERKNMGINNPRADEGDFSQAIFNHQRLAEQLITSIPPTLLDRGIIDCLGYTKIIGNRLAGAEDLRFHNRYRAVFLFEALPFEFDSVRSDFDRANQDRLTFALEKTYRAYGHAVIRVPLGTIPQRAAFVIRQIEQYLGTPIRPSRYMSGEPSSDDYSH